MTAKSQKSEEETAIARQRLSKHTPASMDTHATME
jgi:hypothetical protein